MKDKNGIKLQAGDVVEIKGAYSKRENGFWYVEEDGTNKAFLGDGSNIWLKKISKSGKISTSKYNITEWPLRSMVNGRFKRMEANDWNEKHATIEKVDNIDQSQIITVFEDELKKQKETYRHYELQGYGSDYLKSISNEMEYIERSLARLTA